MMLNNYLKGPRYSGPVFIKKSCLTIFILMDNPIYIDTIRIEISILYFMGLPPKISIKWCTAKPV